MNIQAAVNFIASEISESVVKVHVAQTGSAYIHTNNKRCRVIRISDHTGQKEKARTWQLRKDVMSCRRGTNRIYNSVSSLVNDFKSL